MAQNKELIKRMKKRGMMLKFVNGQNAGCAFPKDKNFNKNETYLAANIRQIKTITGAEWTGKDMTWQKVEVKLGGRTIETVPVDYELKSSQ